MHQLILQMSHNNNLVSRYLRLFSWTGKQNGNIIVKHRILAAF